jgi:nicotinate dehydrogenase subunit B
MIRNSLPKSLVDNPLLSQWIGFEPSGRVRVSTGKVELGQGILTALTQIAAEELDVEPSRIFAISGDTVGGPQEGFTSGSNSVGVSGTSIRLICAETRALFLDEAAGRLACRPGDLLVQDGQFLREGVGSGLDYWSIALDVDLDRPVTGTTQVKDPEAYRLVGQSLQRTDLQKKLDGGSFIHDLAPAGLLHARVLHRPHKDAHLAELDEDSIQRSTGRPVEVIRDGDLVALVSDNETAVMRALEAARAGAVWEGGETVPDTVDHVEWLRAQPVHDQIIDAGVPVETEDMTLVTRSYSRPFLTHGSIGPSCAVAQYQGGQLDVWTHSQGVFTLRDWLARTLNVPADKVNVHHREGAGCYGHNSADDAAFDAAFVAVHRPGKPVKVVWSREDEFRAAPVSPTATVEIRAALDQRWRPMDWTFEIWSPSHARRPGMNGAANLLGAEALASPFPPASATAMNDIPEAIGGGATRNAHALYDLPHHRIIHHMLPEVPLRTSTMRALGSYLNVFAIESFMDELAEMAGEDPVAYRLSLQPDPRARRVIEMAAEMSSWSEPAPASSSSDTVIGRGIGFGRYKNTAAYVAVIAEVEVGEGVSVRHLWAAVDAGLVINPDGASNQIEGGMVQAASWVLKERLAFQDGRPAAAGWEDYPILRFSEVPEVDVRLVHAAHQPTLGIGEASQGPTAGAIANAVANALGARIRDLPLSNERIIATLLA